MKVIRRVGLMVVYPALMLMLGLWGGVRLDQYFYPMRPGVYTEEKYNAAKVETETAEQEIDEPVQDTETGSPAQVAAREETLCADTIYILKETELSDGTQVETTWDLPAQYIGMTREELLMAMENYTAAPPLAEKERGFVAAEVQAFSRERVVVQKTYETPASAEGYYITVQDHEIVVMLGDGESFYMSTGITYDDLPAAVRIQVLQMLYLENEEKLYNFLESYSS